MTGVQTCALPILELTEEAAYTPEELAAYDLYWDTVSTEKTLMEGKYQEGLEKGKAEGKAERDIEIAKAMSAKGCHLDLISQVTGLSLAEIERILG